MRQVRGIPHGVGGGASFPYLTDPFTMSKRGTECTSSIRIRGSTGSQRPERPATEWALEATNRIALERMGITRDSIKPGDSIKARCHPLRDGSRGCLLGFVKTRDGSVKDWDGNNLPIPTDF